MKKIKQNLLEKIITFCLPPFTNIFLQYHVVYIQFADKENMINLTKHVMK